jgi:Family of unknown function (DUF5985)
MTDSSSSLPSDQFLPDLDGDYRRRSGRLLL